MAPPTTYTHFKSYMRACVFERCVDFWTCTYRTHKHHLHSWLNLQIVRWEKAKRVRPCTRLVWAHPRHDFCASWSRMYLNALHQTAWTAGVHTSTLCYPHTSDTSVSRSWSKITSLFESTYICGPWMQEGLCKYAHVVLRTNRRWWTCRKLWICFQLTRILYLIALRTSSCISRI